MQELTPPNAAQVRKIVEERLSALDLMGGTQETTTVEWRGKQLHIAVISMPLDLLSYNPSTHRIRAQRSLDPARDKDLRDDPFGLSAQTYLHHLLMGDPTDPSKTDTSFEALREDLRVHGQSDPGIISRNGVIINGNTRRSALKELGQQNIRVGVLPPDAGYDDLESIELSLQLRRDHRRDYSFMNFLLAVEERANAGRSPAQIQSDFRIRPTTYERSRWILEFVKEAIERSQVDGVSGAQLSMRLVDFETHQGKLEELYRAYMGLKAKSPDQAEALREQRLLAMALDKSKTDLRLIDPDFTHRYMKGILQDTPVDAGPKLRIPGTSIPARAPSEDVEKLKALTTQVLKARAVELAPGAVSPSKVSEAAEMLGGVRSSLEDALDLAGKQGRVIKKRFAPADRLSDARDDLELALDAVAEARSTGNFDPEDLDEALTSLRTNLVKLAQLVTRGSESTADGISWLRAVGNLPTTNG